MPLNFRKTLLLSFLMLPAAAAWSDVEEPAPLALQMEVQLGDQSRDKLADGSASQGESRLTPANSNSTIPYLLGGIVLALAGFAAGRFFKAEQTNEAAEDTPVALWLDAEKLQTDLKELEGELNRQHHSNEELAYEREQLLVLHADQLHKLRGERDELSRELNAIRLRSSSDSDDDPTETIDALRAEIEHLRGADQPGTRDRQYDNTDEDTLRRQLQEQKSHITELEQLLRATQDDNEVLEQQTINQESRLGELEKLATVRDSELDSARQELTALREKAQLLDEKESHVNTLDQEVTALREEISGLLGKTGQYQILIPELENKLFHRTEQVGALESDLEATAHEVAERDRESRQWQEQVRSLQETLEAAETRIISLESDLASAVERNNLLTMDPNTEALQNENLALQQQLRETQDNSVPAAESMDDLQAQRANLEEWNSTITSLQAEIRRKSTLIDSQADHLAAREEQIDKLKTEMAELRKQLFVRSEETESLRGLLEQAGSVVVSLKDEIGAQEHADTRMRLAMNPEQDPFAAHEDAIDPLDADIEALRFTAKSRRELADSLQAILEEERESLEQASRRVASRDEELSFLKHDLSANRLAMLSLQNRLQSAGHHSDSDVTDQMEPARIQRELQQSLKALEAVRTDLQKWRGRVKPLHEALLARNNRINLLESEIAVLRRAQDINVSPGEDELVSDVSALLDRTKNGETLEDERGRTLDEMKNQWDRIVALESDLAGTGAKLARVLELDELRCRQIESLELARSAQLGRLDEIRADLTSHGVDTDLDNKESGQNVVDLGSRRPS